MPTYLIVANQTLGGAELIDHVRERLQGRPCSFYLVVPATPPKEHLTWTEGEAHSIAEHRLAEGIDRLRSLGTDVDGEVGDASPMLAVDDALRNRTVDGIIVTTLPMGLSRWLKLSLPDRLARKYDVPVTHIVVEPAPSAAR
jgi:nucleotide-binding universal stress UspA family protein